MIRTMQLSDIKLLKLPEIWMEERYIEYLTNNTGPAWILEDDNGKPLAAWGAAILWDGVGEVWFNLIRHENIKFIVRTIKVHLTDKTKEWGLWRLHASIKGDFEIGKRFAEFFGFKFEGNLKAYNPDGSDAAMFALVRRV